ncbi:hypothetical protein L6452_19783 [Arctium lappa]|uniref:Uncharacterized protein n=1 Tax=Arctium lappa TaxID=4217 RepID=A0ACB9BAD7_ARCLA|nr:hypothetical protein L6452_19783 [Arctium lappa]
MDEQSNPGNYLCVDLMRGQETKKSLFKISKSYNKSKMHTELSTLEQQWFYKINQSLLSYLSTNSIGVSEDAYPKIIQQRKKRKVFLKLEADLPLQQIRDYNRDVESKKEQAEPR